MAMRGRFSQTQAVYRLPASFLKQDHYDWLFCESGELGTWCCMAGTDQPLHGFASGSGHRKRFGPVRALLTTLAGDCLLKSNLPQSGRGLLSSVPSGTLPHHASKEVTGPCLPVCPRVPRVYGRVPPVSHAVYHRPSCDLKSNKRIVAAVHKLAHQIDCRYQLRIWRAQFLKSADTMGTFVPLVNFSRMLLNFHAWDAPPRLARNSPG
jgi:hypothetical protein